MFDEEKKLKIGKICSYTKRHQKLTHMQESRVFDKFSLPF